MYNQYVIFGLQVFSSAKILSFYQFDSWPLLILKPFLYLFFYAMAGVLTNAIIIVAELNIFSTLVI